MTESRKPILLLIDSRPQELKVLQEMLGDMDLVCCRADCGDEAMEVLHEEACFLAMVFLDQPDCCLQAILNWLGQRSEELMAPVLLLAQRPVIKDIVREHIFLATVDFVETPVVPEILCSKVAFFLEFYHRNLSLAAANEQLREFVAEAESLGEQALAADQAKTRFLARMSHEIRTPMTAILGYANLAQRLLHTCPRHSEAQACRAALENIDVMIDNTRHLMALIDDIINVSKIQSGQMVIEYVDCEVLDIVVSVVTLYKAQAVSRGVDLILEAPGPIPRVMQSDPTRLRQGLMNLLDNAIKFTKRGSVKVYLRWVEAAEDSILHLQIIDTGCGIASDQIKFVLNPFEQADSDITRHYGGTGLGLTLTHRIASILGGQLDIKSQESLGTTVTLSLPTGQVRPEDWLENPEEVIQSLMHDEPMVVHPEKIHFKGHVLLAEDTPANRWLIVQMLQLMGLAVDEAVNGEQACQKIQERDYDLVLMDLHMPICSGFEATERLRRQGLTTPIVALTADVLQATRERCQRTGFSGFASKPIDYDKLVEELKRHLDIDNTPEDQLQEPLISAPGPERSMSMPTSCEDSNLDIIDPQAAIAQMHVDMSTYLGALEQTLPWLEDQVKALMDALNQSDTEVVGRQAHAIKSASGTLAMQQVHSLAYNLEMTAKGRQDGDMGDLTEKLKEALSEASQAGLELLRLQGDGA